MFTKVMTRMTAVEAYSEFPEIIGPEAIRALGCLRYSFIPSLHRSMIPSIVPSFHPTIIHSFPRYVNS